MNRKKMMQQMITGSLVAGNLSAFEALATQLPKTETMPALFVGHGSPMNAIEDNRFVQGFRKIAKTIPIPKAILCISAHWFTKGTRVTAMQQPRTIHDFGGFPKALYEVQYPAPGNPDLAKTAAELVKPTVATLDQEWGLDHGAWTVAMHMYPDAEIPVVQMSIDRTLKAEGHFKIGKQLQELRNRGVLILGSGNIVHNLGLVDFRNMDRPDYGYDWAVEARQFVNQCIIKGDYQPLFDYQKQGRAMKLAVPTAEHYLPLLYILGLQHDPEKNHFFNDEMLAGSLSMTSLRIS